MPTEGDPLENFDLVVKTFAEAVRLSVLPAVLDVSSPMADGAGGRVDFLHIRSRVLLDLFRQLILLDGVGEGGQDIVEKL